MEQLFPQNADVSPFLIERLQDFFLGGMDDMTLWVADRWHVTADLLEYGSEYVFIFSNQISFHGHHKTLMCVSSCKLKRKVEFGLHQNIQFQQLDNRQLKNN